MIGIGNVTVVLVSPLILTSRRRGAAVRVDKLGNVLRERVVWVVLLGELVYNGRNKFEVVE